MDEVSFLVELITGGNITSSLPASFTTYNAANSPDVADNWAGSADIVFGGGNGASKAPTPNVIDIRNLGKNRGARYDLSKKDVIIVFEDSQDIEYPTIDWSVRNESFTMTMNIRTIVDERAGANDDDGDNSFGKERLENLYKVLRHRIESHRKGATVTLSGEVKKFNQLVLNSRSESNDRKKRIYGYKITVSMKKFATSL